MTLWYRTSRKSL